MIAVAIAFQVSANQEDDLGIPIPKETPTISKAGEMFLFNKIGTLSPVLQFVHIRTTVNLRELEQLAIEICSYEAIVHRLQVFWEPNNHFMEFKHSKTSEQTVDNLKIHPSLTKMFNTTAFQRWKEGEHYLGWKASVQRRSMSLRNMCRQAKDKVILVKTLYSHNKLSLKHSAPRKKRSFGGAISLLFSLFQEVQLYDLSSRVDRVQQAQKHIIVGMAKLTEAMQQIDLNQRTIAHSIVAFREEYTFNKLRFAIDDRMDKLTAMAMHLANEIDTTTEGLFKGLEGKLAPRLVDATTLMKSLAELEKEAARRNLDFITSAIAHVFELPTSVYTDEGYNTVDIITHIPVIESNSDQEVPTTIRPRT